MEKEARKKSEDPVQENLRNHKDVWNHSASTLIAKLIAFKRGLNGRGDAKAGLPAGSIKEPMPMQIGSYLDHLTSEFESLVSGAESIIDEQEHYSETRRKPQESHFADDGFEKEAAWFGRRWKASYFGGDSRERPFLREMIRSTQSMKDKLISIENALSSSHINSVPEAVKISSSFGIGPWKNILESLGGLASLHGKSFSSLKDEEKKAEKEAKEKAKKDKQKDKGLKPGKDAQPEEEGAILRDPKLILRSELSNILLNINSAKIVGEYLISVFEDEKKKAAINSLVVSINRGAFINQLIGKLDTQIDLSKSEKTDANLTKYHYNTLLNLANEVFQAKFVDFKEMAKSLNNDKIPGQEQDDTKPEAVAETPVEPPKAEDDKNSIDDSIKVAIDLSNPLSRGVKKLWLEHKPDILRTDVDLDTRKRFAISHIQETITFLDKFLDYLTSTKTKPTAIQQDPQKDQVSDKKDEKDFSKSNLDITGILKMLTGLSQVLSIVLEDIIVLAEYHNSLFLDEYRNKSKYRGVAKGVTLQNIYEKEINKLRKAFIGVKEMSDKILINAPAKMVYEVG